MYFAAFNALNAFQLPLYVYLALPGPVYQPPVLEQVEVGAKYSCQIQVLVFDLTTLVILAVSEDPRIYLILKLVIFQQTLSCQKKLVRH